MATANILSIDGAVKGSIELPPEFQDVVRVDLIMRAVIAENTLKLQPQGHYPLAGMQTTARYYGAMSSYRSGRHQGIAIRPRQKLGGGRQGQVRRIPSSVKGKRAHPHVVEKTLIERINNKEYQKAIKSAVAATASKQYVTKRHGGAYDHLPIIVSDDIESAKKTSQIVKILSALKLSNDMAKSAASPSIRKGKRRLSLRKHYRKTVLIVVNDDKGAIHAARNIPGVDVCTTSGLTASLLAPGGLPGRITVWSESAVKNLDSEIQKLKPR